MFSPSLFSLYLFLSLSLSLSYHYLHYSHKVLPI
ncbi:unnamed protein product [Spirodela intermedia]|uniref:Uncharacterized protein n=2 Tax=Spirodela intermedia TaxID=51605 RepID=A0A7I8KXN6_SPIIN|nr:unnamed protein product [Spirodela intermedia]CAA7402451.1 unnamed protein product [Spirodela intermedia]